MYDSRTVHGREVLARVVEAFGDKVFHTVIARTMRFPETTVAGEPITTYASASAGAAAYRELARELLARSSAECCTPSASRCRWSCCSELRRRRAPARLGAGAGRGARGGR